MRVRIPPAWPASVAQLEERSVSNRQAKGANPFGSASFISTEEKD